MGGVLQEQQESHRRRGTVRNEGLHPAMDASTVAGWTAQLKRVLGAQAPPALKMKPRWGYVSPLDPEVLQAWVERGNDPGIHVCDWVRQGAPLGIETPIPTAGIFPQRSPTHGLPGPARNRRRGGTDGQG